MNKFLSCDWGTSSFRLRLVEVGSLRILAEEKTDQGIAKIHNLWEKTGHQTTDDRLIFYLKVIQEHIGNIIEKLSISLKGIPLVISGMASSSIGMLNLPYGPLPFHTSGKGIETKFFKEGEILLDHPILLISGIKSENDVMRGEETQLIGIMTGIEDINSDQLFIFPGTHSKHIKVSDGQVIDFETYMTGEYFELLSKKSILSSNVDDTEEGESHSERNIAVFKQGVRKAVRTNLLNASFWVRTNELFGKINKKENLHFLSGLLIGTELKELLKEDSVKIHLCCSSTFKPWYEAALKELGISEILIFSGKKIDEAVIKGQLQIYNQLKING